MERKTIDKVYLFDGTINGFLTIVHNCFVDQSIPLNIFSENNYISNLLDDTIYIATNESKAESIFMMLSKQFNKEIINKIITTFLSYAPEKDFLILNYIFLLYDVGNHADFMRDNDIIIRLNILHAKIGGENHLLTGFLRFEELERNILYAKIEPENDVLIMLANHFMIHLPKENFIIHDIGRGMCAMYNQNELFVTNDKSLDLTNIRYSETEELIQDMWKTFFKTIAIKSRTNPRCQANLMPRKFWKHMTEMKEN